MLDNLLIIHLWIYFLVKLSSKQRSRSLALLYFQKISVNFTLWSIRESRIMYLLKWWIPIIIVIVFIENFTDFLMAMPVRSLAFLISNDGNTVNAGNAAHIICDNSFSDSSFILIVHKVYKIVFMLITTDCIVYLLVLSIKIIFS